MGSLLHNALDVPLYEEVTGLDAWQVCRQFASLPHLLFLDSAEMSARGRYSFVAADPFAWLWARGATVGENEAILPARDPFAVLADRLDRYRLQSIAGLPPFQGGVAGLLGYDLCHHLERLPRPRYDDCPTPDLAVGLYDWVVSFDRETDRAWLVSTGFPEIEPRWGRGGAGGGWG
jgi:para-aminobenzoate synthetase component I